MTLVYAVYAVYAVYVVGNVAALLLFGQLSDQIGRKRAARRRWRWPPRARCCSSSPPTPHGCSSGAG
jgi:MFS family permease